MTKLSATYLVGYDEGERLYSAVIEKLPAHERRVHVADFLKGMKEALEACVDVDVETPFED